MKLSFVLSRYKEPISLQEFVFCVKNYIPKNIELELITYDKHQLQPDSYKLVENVGRENYAWFDYVIKTWDNPSDYYAFSHLGTHNVRSDKLFANAFFLTQIEKMVFESKDFCTSRPCYSVNLEYSKKDKWTGSTSFNIEDVKKQTFKPTNYKNLGEWWSDLTDESPPKIWNQFGMCCGSKQNLHSWGKDFWEKIFDQIKDGGANGEISHFLERSMLRIVEGKKLI